MSDRYHSKFHKTNHHTYGVSDDPDSSFDPIASPSDPFRGDFVLAGGLSAYAPLSAYAGYFANTLNSVYLATPTAAVSAIGNIKVTGNLILDGNLYTANGYNTLTEIINAPAGTAYSFAAPLVKDEVNRVGLLIDNNTLLLDNNGVLKANFAALSNLSATFVGENTKYSFFRGLSSRTTYTTCNNVLQPTICTSVNTDNSTITINNANQLALVNNYTYTNGLSSSTSLNQVGIFTDDSTLTVCEGKLQSKLCFNNTGSGLVRSGNNIVINTGPSLNTCGNTLNVAYSFANGVCLNNNAISVLYDSSTIGLDASNRLKTVNTLTTNLGGTTQTVSGPVTYASTLRALSGITFSDGSSITSSSSVRPYVKKLTKLNTTDRTGSVITSDNRILTWGNNDHNIVGPDSIWPPQAVNFDDDYVVRGGYSIVKAIQTRFCLMVLLNDGTVWICGYNPNNQLGVTEKYDGNRLYELTKVTFPISGTVISDIEACSDENAGWVHLAAITSTGALYLWGKNDNNALSGSGVITTPIIPSSSGGSLSSGVTQVRLYYYDGYAYTVALKSDGTIYSCGYNGHGELGNGNKVSQNTFVQSRLKDLNNNFLNLKVTRLVNTNSWCIFSNMVLAEDGKLYVCGYNAPVYHGTSTTWGSEDTYLKPVANLTNVIDCVSGGSWTKNCFMALSLDGTVRTWGNNDGGQLGLGDSTDRYTPTLVPVIRAKKLAEVNGWNPNTSFVLIGSDGYVYVAGNRVPNQRGAWTENTKTFNRVPIPNITDVTVSTHSGTFNGVILLDNLNRVFVSTSYDGHYFGGPQNTAVRNVAEFTNYLV